MDYLKIKSSILEVFKECDVNSFPIDCFKLLKMYGFKTKSYNSQSSKKKQGCFVVSNDAFTLKNTVFYNDNMPYGRVRFSLMHELGHLVLGHGVPRIEQHEKEADYFASHILAPRMAIHYARCKNLNDVSKLFYLTFEAADYAFRDYRRWHRYVTYHKMSELDKSMYSHFYSDEHKKFVYTVKECTLCGRKLINFNKDSCQSHHSLYEPRIYYHQDPLESSLLREEKRFLYGGL